MTVPELRTHWRLQKEGRESMLNTPENQQLFLVECSWKKQLDPRQSLELTCPECYLIPIFIFSFFFFFPGSQRTSHFFMNSPSIQDTSVSSFPPSQSTTASLPAFSPPPPSASENGTANFISFALVCLSVTTLFMHLIHSQFLIIRQKVSPKVRRELVKKAAWICRGNHQSISSPHCPWNY